MHQTRAHQKDPNNSLNQYRVQHVHEFVEFENLHHAKVFHKKNYSLQPNMEGLTNVTIYLFDST